MLSYQSTRLTKALRATYLDTPLKKSSLPTLVLGALGVVYGDIGTSVLYALKAVFVSGHIEPTEQNIYGVLSLFFWTLSLIVTLKYVTLVLRADNHGEGGVVALLALVANAVRGKSTLRRSLLALGIFGACLFYGDGVITPAISVLSAVEGLKLVSPAFDSVIIPCTLVILFILFWSQKQGTSSVAKYFGPIMVLWFLVIALLGIINILPHMHVLQALSPHYMLVFIGNNPGTAFIVLSAVVLCVTGGEALYADMGHFGRRPIQLAWYALVMPALVLNYFGQGALLLSQPTALENPFFALAPTILLVPLVTLATIATVIASQALISGVFSVTKQVIQLDYLPRLQVIYTNEQETGQIYLPFVNWILFAAIVLTVLIFDSADNLAGAYGVAVTSNMVITTTLTFFVLMYVWQYPWYLALIPTAFFLGIDVIFWLSNLLKIVEGGWFPLVIAFSLFLLMSTWHLGRLKQIEKMQHESIPLLPFFPELLQQWPERTEGTAIFLTANANFVPKAFLHNLKHNKVIHKQIIIVTVINHAIPRVAEHERLQFTAIADNCWQVWVNFGFMDETNLPLAIQPMQEQGCELNPMLCSYFISRETIIPQAGSHIPMWQAKIFVQLHRNASAVADFLKLPNGSVIELGAKVDF